MLAAAAAAIFLVAEVIATPAAHALSEAGNEALVEPSYTFSFPLDAPQFCSDHSCAYTTGSCCTAPCQTADSHTPHMIYMHVEKTGGSAVECAWQQAARQGYVDLLGHSPAFEYETCASRCAVPTKKVITVREPYGYWASVYRYTWRCIFGACSSGYSTFIVEDTNYSAVVLPNQKGALSSFDAFLEYAAGSVEWRRCCSLTSLMQAKCGQPPLTEAGLNLTMDPSQYMCDYDELLHTETLTDDWASLLRRYPGLPQVALPRINEDSSYADHPWGEPPNATYTPHTQRLVQHLDSWIFDYFDYPR